MIDKLTKAQANILASLSGLQRGANRKTGRNWLSLAVLDAYDARSWRSLFTKGYVRFMSDSRIQVLGL